MLRSPGEKMQMKSAWQRMAQRLIPAITTVNRVSTIATFRTESYNGDIYAKLQKIKS